MKNNRCIVILITFFFVVTQINNRNSGLQTEQKCIDWSNEQKKIYI